MFGKRKKARLLVFKLAVESGNPRVAHEAAQRAFWWKSEEYAADYTGAYAGQMLNVIRLRSDLAARKDDYLYMLRNLQLAPGQPDSIVREMAEWYSGSLIPEVARFAQEWELRCSLISKMLAAPPQKLVDIYDALEKRGLPQDSGYRYATQLAILAIVHGDAEVLRKVERHLLHRAPDQEGWRQLILGQMQRSTKTDVATTDAIFVAAHHAVS